MSEFSHKINLLRDLAARHDLEAVLLQRASNFAWITCGASAYINTASGLAEAALLVTADRQVLITNNIEAPRLEEEEALTAQGWEFRVGPWYRAGEAVADLTRGMKIGADLPLPGAFNLMDVIPHLRANLTPEEGERFRALGSLCAQAIDAAARSVRPGQSEHAIAGLLAGEAEGRGVQATVNLIATDERIFDFRHPLPTAKKLTRYAMLVLCGRKQGLVCSVTRFVHFGRLPDEIRRKAEALARVDAAMIAATRPGRRLGEIFRDAIAAYARQGYADEWQKHHQGGPAGYEPREYIATPDSPEQVLPGQVYAWNPSITGTKSEDTILIGESGNEILTSIPAWPAMTVEVDGGTLERPAILEVT
jgi:antitoxin VapB